MPFKHSHQALGRLGERLAQQFLLKQGYLLLRENYLIRGGQVDLVMLSPHGGLVFVEVKTRIAADYPISQEESLLSARQRQILKRTALTFLGNSGDSFTTWQLDLIWINLERRGRDIASPKIKHFQNILEI